jgi:predicted transposase/invertase (TIGR01784 family)
MVVYNYIIYGGNRMRRFLDPKNDFAFKKLFGEEKRKSLLISFLNDIFDGVHEKIEDVEFLKLAQNPEIAMLRQSIVDVLCRDKKGHSWIIEMQCARDSAFIKRAAAYACRVYLNQRTTEKDKGYKDLRPVIFLAILDYKLFPNKEAYLSHHKLQDIVTGENDIKDFSFSFLELSKFKRGISELNTTIEKWAYFFKNAEGAEPNEVERMISGYPAMREAFDTMAEGAFTTDELLEYDRYEMKADEIATGLSDAKREGLAEGELKKARETAISMLEDGIPTNVISKYTGLSTAEVKKLKRTI